jgi:hypothetical protein
MPTSKAAQAKQSTQKPARSSNPDRKERVVTASNGQRMRSTLAQMQQARKVPLISPQRQPQQAPRPKASLLRPSSR